MRVLIVEDEIKMASLIRRGLRGEGLAADVAITGEDALWMAAATDYDVIVLDVQLPGIDGFETCRRLRQDGVRPPILEAGDLRLEPATRRVWRGETEIELSAKEFALLEEFMRRPGEVLSR